MTEQAPWVHRRPAGPPPPSGGETGRDSPARAAESVSSSGMDPRTGSALAYLAGPFSAVLMLWAESSNRDVRFHAWQSIFGLGGLGLVVAATYVCATAAIFTSATAASALFVIATVLWGVLVVVWAVCLWQALSGRRWKLPLAGTYAERFVTNP